MQKDDLREIDKYIWDDWFDNEHYNDMALYLNDKKINICMDVGAAVGVTTQWMLEKLNPTTILSLEPDSTNFIILYNNFKNHHKVYPYPYGIFYGYDWSLVQHMGDNNPLGGMSTAVETVHSGSGEELKRYSDKIFHLKELEWFSIMPDLIKIDVEGSEFNIIENSSLVQRCKFILLETHNHDRVYIEKYLQDNLPHKVVYTKGEGIHLGFLLEL